MNSVLFLMMFSKEMFMMLQCKFTANANNRRINHKYDLLNKWLPSLNADSKWEEFRSQINVNNQFWSTYFDFGFVFQEQSGKRSTLSIGWSHAKILLPKWIFSYTWIAILDWHLFTFEIYVNLALGFPISTHLSTELDFGYTPKNENFHEFHLKNCDIFCFFFKSKCKSKKKKSDQITKSRTHKISKPRQFHQ